MTYTLAEASEWLGIPYGTVAEWCRLRGLAHRKSGVIVLIEHDDLMRWLCDRKPWARRAVWSAPTRARIRGMASAWRAEQLAGEARAGMDTRTRQTANNRP